MQNIQIAAIAWTAHAVAGAYQSWDDLPEDEQSSLVEKVHAIREGEDYVSQVFTETARACLAEGDAFADEYDGQAVEVRNGALAYAIQHHKGPDGTADPKTVIDTAGRFEKFLRDGVRDGAA